jgi:hypothetical protein
VHLVNGHARTLDAVIPVGPIELDLAGATGARGARAASQCKHCLRD